MLILNLNNSEYIFTIYWLQYEIALHFKCYESYTFCFRLRTLILLEFIYNEDQIAFDLFLHFPTHSLYNIRQFTTE